MIFLTLLKVIDGEENRNAKMAVVGGGGALEIVLGLISVYFIRRDHQWVAVAAILSCVGVELVFITWMGGWAWEVTSQVVIIILAVHGFAIVVAILMTLVVLTSAARAREERLREIEFLDKIQQERKDHVTFHLHSPRASQRIGRMFK